MTEKLKCHFQSDLVTNNSGIARRIFINHRCIFRTFIHHGNSPSPTFKNYLGMEASLDVSLQKIGLRLLNLLG